MSEVKILVGENTTFVEAEKGEVLGDVIASADLPVEQPCAGRGTCGRCKVLVEKGASAPDEIERTYLSESELHIGTRLACRAQVSGETQVVLSSIEVYSNKVFKAGSRHKKEQSVPLGLAIDFGSTTVAAYLTILDNGEVVAGGAALNQQRVYGADVISRLAAALQSDEHRERLQRLALSSIYQAINSLKLSKSLLGRVERVSIVGNVAMHHLLIGLPVEKVAMVPFQPYSNEPIVNKKGLLDGLFGDEVQIMIPPVIGGFVGSDALACLVHFDFDKAEDPILAIDLGTNGEVLLTDGGQIVTASTAAGPAFEGVDISCGMRAVDGAIVDAKFKNGCFEFETIGNESPLGLTGSGLMKLVHELLHLGVIASSGRFVGDNEYFTVEKINGSKRIYLLEDRSVWLTQKDIRELQKAKGAIRAAVEILLQTLELEATDLKRVILTGSFGGQLDVSAVLSLGMLPNLSQERVENIPNGAGFGAAEFLSNEGFARGIQLAKAARQIDLDQVTEFHEVFIESLHFEGVA